MADATPEPGRLGVARTRLLVALPLLALIPLAVLSVLVMVELWGAQQRQLHASVASNASALAAVIEENVGGSLRRLESLATDRSVRSGNMRDFHERAQEILAGRKDWSAVVLMRVPDYQHVMNTRLPPGAPLPIAGEQAHLAEVVRTRAPVVSDLFVGRVAGEPIINIAVPVMRDGQVAYVLTATLDPSALSALLQRHLRDPGGIAGIVDAKHRIVARTRDPAGFVGKSLRPELHEALNRDAQGMGRFTVADAPATETYTAWAPIGRTGWTLLLGTPAAPADAALRRSLEWLAAAFVVVLALSGALAWHTGRTLARTEEERRRLLNDERQARREAEEARGQAESASRAKDEFLAMLSHELRNPLAAISNAAYLLRGTALAPAGAQAEGVITRQAAHLGRILSDLLDVSRAVSGKIVLRPTTVDLQQIARNALAAIQAASGLSSRHRVALDARETWVEGDAARLEQIFQNLIGNAFKFTPAGGEIRIGVREDQGQALFEVTDTGVGIQPAVMPRIFDLFVQGDTDLARGRGGLGIGLTLAKRLVELHQGTIAVDSAGEGRGSTFRVRLPLSAAPAARSEALPAQTAAKGLDVLVVEDNPDTGDTMVRALRLEGYDARWARDGMEALHAADQRVPDACLIDIGLPGMDGLELARRLRAKFRDLLLVAVTGYGQEEDRRRAREAGCDAHLTKPVEISAIAALIAKSASGYSQRRA